jgi:hypothetical protein
LLLVKNSLLFEIGSISESEHIVPYTNTNLLSVTRICLPLRPWKELMLCSAASRSLPTLEIWLNASGSHFWSYIPLNYVDYKIVQRLC